MSCGNLADLRSSDVKRLLIELVDESSPEKIKSILKTLYDFCLENKDAVNEMFDKRVVEVLVKLYNNEKGYPFQGQISSILVLLSFEGDKKRESGTSDIVLTALSNISSVRSDVDIFLQSVSGIKDIATFSPKPATSRAPAPSLSPASSSSSDSPPSPSPPAHVLSVSSSAAVLEKAATLLLSPALNDFAKQQVLDALLQLVNAGVMNQAAEFAAWRQTKVLGGGGGRSGGSGAGGGGGGGGGEDSGGGCGVQADPSVKFAKAFESFTEAVKRISLVKKKSVLGFATERAYHCIQENDFFPTFVSMEPTTKNSLKFLANAIVQGEVTNSGNKLLWNSQGYFSYFVDPEISAGLYKITLECNGQLSHLVFGLAVKRLLGTLANTHLYSQASGTCCIFNSQIIVANIAVFNGTFFPSSGKTTLDLELDADKHVLYFFVNEAQIPHCVVNVPPSVHFGITGYNLGFSAELKSLAKLTSPSVNPSLSCARYNWK